MDRPVDPSALEWKSRTALTSLRKSLGEDNAEERGSGESEGLAPLLCYACLTTFTPAVSRRNGNVGGPVALPFWIGERVAQRRDVVGREEMRVEIGEYLLDGGDDGS